VTPLYVDDHILIIDKPAGLLSVPGRSEPDCVVTRLQVDFPDALTVHRLDMATSGVMVFAHRPEVQRILSMAFAARQVTKRYIAVIAGETPDEGEVDLPLITDWPNRPRQMVDHAIGKPSLTRYRTLSRGEATSRVELEPVTGRSHQLRVHMMAIGHPILGDEFYAPPVVFSQASRLLLHAQSLSLPHPHTGETMTFTSAPGF